MPHPAHWISSIPALPRPLQPLTIVQYRIHIPRTQAVHSDTITTPLRRQTLCKRKQRRFGRVVRTLWLWVVCVVRGNRCCEDDAAARALGADLACDGLRAEKGAGEVDVVRAAPFVGEHFDGVRAAHDAGETAQHVDAAEYFDAAFDRRRDLRFVTDIHGFGDDAPVRELGVQKLDRLKGFVGLEVPKC